MSRKDVSQERKEGRMSRKSMMKKLKSRKEGSHGRESSRD